MELFKAFVLGNKLNIYLCKLPEVNFGEFANTENENMYAIQNTGKTGV